MFLKSKGLPVQRAIWLVLTLSGVGAATAETQTLEDCVIEPNRVAEVSSAISGVIEKVTVERGDLVKRGQAVVTLESKVEKATVELARARAERDQAIEARRARLEFTQRRLERNRGLFEQSLISEQVVDEAETDVLLAELELGEFLEERAIAALELERAQAALAQRTIRSPFEGVVVDVLVAPGESIENRPLLKIASIDPLNVEVIAPVPLFGRIKPGMSATVIPEEPIGGEHTAKVAIVDRVLDAASGTFGIRLQLRNSKYRLPAGLRCKVTFEDLQLSVLGDEAADTEGRASPDPGDAADSDYVYTVYLFSTRSAEIADEVNRKFRARGLETRILQTSTDSVSRYRIGVTGFGDLDAAKNYSASVAGTLGIAKTWIGKNRAPE